MTSEQILAEIEKAWIQGRCGFRDSLIKVGRLCHQYIFSSLKEYEGKSVRQRQKDGVTRKRLLEQVAEIIDVSAKKIRKMIAVAMTVDLLSDNGQCGELPFSSILLFSKFIKRGAFESASTYEAQLQASSTETWRIAAVDGHDPRKTFQQAVKENWPWDKVRRAVETLPGWRLDLERKKKAGIKTRRRTRSDRQPQRINPSTNGVHQATTKRRNGDGDDPYRHIRNGSIYRQAYPELNGEEVSYGPPLKLEEIAKAATPRDLADMIAEMILAANEPVTVAELVMQRLEREFDLQRLCRD